MIAAVVEEERLLPKAAVGQRTCDAAAQPCALFILDERELYRAECAARQALQYLYFGQLELGGSILRRASTRN